MSNEKFKRAIRCHFVTVLILRLCNKGTFLFCKISATNADYKRRDLQIHATALIVI